MLLAFTSTARHVQQLSGAASSVPSGRWDKGKGDWKEKLSLQIVVAPKMNPGLGWSWFVIEMQICDHRTFVFLAKTHDLVPTLSLKNYVLHLYSKGFPFQPW